MPRLCIENSVYSLFLSSQYGTYIYARAVHGEFSLYPVPVSQYGAYMYARAVLGELSLFPVPVFIVWDIHVCQGCVWIIQSILCSCLHSMGHTCMAGLCMENSVYSRIHSTVTYIYARAVYGEFSLFRVPVSQYGAYMYMYARAVHGEFSLFPVPVFTVWDIHVWQGCVWRIQSIPCSCLHSMGHTCMPGLCMEISVYSLFLSSQYRTYMYAKAVHREFSLFPVPVFTVWDIHVCQGFAWRIQSIPCSCQVHGNKCMVHDLTQLMRILQENLIVVFFI